MKRTPWPFNQMSVLSDESAQSPLDQTKGGRLGVSSLPRRYSGASDVLSPELLEVRSKWRSQFDQESINGRGALPSLSTAARSLICTGTAIMIFLVLGIYLSQLLSQGRVPIKYHILFILSLVALFILFCHSTVRLCMTTSPTPPQHKASLFLHAPRDTPPRAFQSRMSREDEGPIQAPPPAYCGRTNSISTSTLPPAYDAVNVERVQ